MELKIILLKEVTVNEQNPQAVGFYEHMGFETYKRTDHDEDTKEKDYRMIWKEI